MDIREFYAETGKLLYAVAEVDGAITEKRKRSLTQSYTDKAYAA